MNWKNKYIYSIIVLSVCLFCISCKQKSKEYINNKGAIYGTYYSITYLQPEGKDLHEEIQQRMRDFELSLSVFEPASVISKINRDEDVITDEYFERMYKIAEEVSEKTNGAFDITVAPLVNAWGFGFKKGNDETPNIEELLTYTGYEKIRLENHTLIKEDSRIMLDASAIAKGYSCDVIADLLEEYGCENYLVEIGGEINCKGINTRGDKWKVGIDVPKDDPGIANRELQTVVAISNVGLATSGNYRQFYYRDEKKYSHTIDPRTGFPVEHNLLSATVIAPSCIQADAYATAFMVLGKDSSLIICNSVEDMECYLIYENLNGEMDVAYTKGFEKYLVN